jgi:hypothetical protein
VTPVAPLGTDPTLADRPEPTATGFHESLERSGCEAWGGANDTDRPLAMSTMPLGLGMVTMMSADAHQPISCDLLTTR